ncbi:MAG: hypothetical protein IJC43_10515 [Clostridia bacterium]|nr:hypothetical protein [Clostridia bacterium]
MNRLILESLSLIDERHLADCLTPPRRRPRRLLPALAACLCLTVALSAPAWLWQAGSDAAAGDGAEAPEESGGGVFPEAETELQEHDFKTESTESGNGGFWPDEEAEPQPQEDSFLPPSGEALSGTAEGGSEESATEQPVSPRPDDSSAAVYNDISHTLSGSRLWIPGYFEETVDAAELAELLPEDLAALATVTAATAGFDGEGAPVELRLSLDLATGAQALLALAPDPLPRCYAAADDGEAVSTLAGQPFVLWRQAGEVLTLAAVGALPNDVHLQLTLSADSAGEGAARPLLEKLLTVLVLDPPTLPRRSGDEIPFWQDTALTHAEALRDADFGALFPTAPPDGFLAESIRRFTDAQHDTLSGLWCKGLAELSWTVRRFEAEDAARLVAPGERERYDLALYPIPRADSVPEALREVVACPVFEADDLSAELLACRADVLADKGDVEGARFRFAVRCGALLVEVRSKGVAQEWLLEVLTGLTE